MSNKKLTPEDIVLIKNKFRDGVSIEDLSLQFKVHSSTIARHLTSLQSHKIASVNRATSDKTMRKLNLALSKYVKEEDLSDCMANLLKDFYIEFLGDREDDKYFPIIELEG